MMDTRFDFYRRQYGLLMRAILTAVEQLDHQKPQQARKTLAAAWDNAVMTSYQTFIAETAP
ncbi:MAG: hypothetical protein ACI4O6_05930 [Dysosmobacter sp.]